MRNTLILHILSENEYRNMKVSIITVVFNGATTIRDCIESVLAQTYTDIEYIIIDGKSTDGTVKIVESYSRKIALFHSGPDKGLYDAMNKGLCCATGDIIGILNSDDFYYNQHVVAHIVQRFKDTSADGIYADLVYVDAVDTNRIKRYWRAGLYWPGAFRWGWMPPHPTFFIKRSVYKQFGCFNPSLGSAADYELMLRFIHKNKIHLEYLPEVVTVMRMGGISNRTIANRIAANRNDRKAWEINGLKPYFFTLWLKPLYKILQFVRRPGVESPP